MSQEDKKPKKKIVLIAVLIAVLLLCCIAPIIISITLGIFGQDENPGRYTEPATITDPLWLNNEKDLGDFQSDKELMELLGINIGEDYFRDILDNYYEDLEEIIIEEKEEEEIEEEEIITEMYTYSNEFFPELTFQYPSTWQLFEKLENSEMLKDAKDLDLTLRKGDYELFVSAISVGPMGLHAICYEDLEYTRIKDEIIRSFDGVGYSYGYFYDNSYDKKTFEEIKDLEGDGDYIGCGDINILKGTPTTFTDEMTEDNLSAILTIFLQEKGAYDENIIRESDEIIKQL